jgi:hypothetical protein
MPRLDFISEDGCRYVTMSAREFSKIPIWNGNRLIDEGHVDRIRESLHGNIKLLNSNLYRIILTKNEDGTDNRQIVDGQHRACILKEYFNTQGVEDFTVLVGGKRCESEGEIIDYFKILNNTKAIPWKEDPKLRANAYIKALEEEFNTDKKRPYVRCGNTNRPFLSADKIRDILIAKHILDWRETPKEFAQRARERNETMLNGLRVKDPQIMRDMEARAVGYKFALGLDDKFTWI